MPFLKKKTFWACLSIWIDGTIRSPGCWVMVLYVDVKSQGQSPYLTGIWVVFAPWFLVFGAVHFPVEVSIKPQHRFFNRSSSSSHILYPRAWCASITCVFNLHINTFFATCLGYKKCPIHGNINIYKVKVIKALTCVNMAAQLPF